MYRDRDRQRQTMVKVIWNSKTCPSDAPPPTMTHLLILLKAVLPTREQAFKHMSIKAILFQTNTGSFLLDDSGLYQIDKNKQKKPNNQHMRNKDATSHIHQASPFSDRFISSGWWCPAG